MHLLLNRFCVNQSLEEALQITYKLLQSFATAEDFTSKMRIAFGDRFNLEAANKLATDWQRGDFTALPEITIRPKAEINGAMGAFAKATNKIYLASEYLAENTGNHASVASVLLEEIGHYVDAYINEIEAPGDEGAIFSLLVRGESLTTQQLQRLRTEDDFATIIIDGQTIEIEQATFTGTDGDDTLPANGNDNNGNDTFNPLLGNDAVDAGEGIDLLIVNYATASSPIFSNNSGYYGEYSGYYYTSSGDSVSFNGIERFNITGTNSEETISGGFDNDTLNGGYGNDTIVGGGGIDKIDGGAGIDVLMNADFANATTSLVIDNTGSTKLALTNGSSVSGIELFENLSTGSGNDRITFSQRSDDNINTGDGNDTINSGLGNDYVNGGDGTDVLVVNYAATISSSYSMPVFVYLDGSVNYGYGYYNNSVGDGGYYSNIERFNFTGTKFNDTISGGADNDTLNGGYGDDIIEGGGGIDKIDGGAGIDILMNANFASATTSLVLDDTGNTKLVLPNGISVSGIELFEDLSTGSGNDRITFTQVSNNAIIAGSGNDTINSGLGSDYVDGGDGTDVLIVDYATAGDSGSGMYSYNTGDNSIYFSAFSGASDDQISCSNIEQFNVTGTNAEDFITGGVDSDTLNGGYGNDTIEGGGGIDKIDGGAGIDVLVNADFANATTNLVIDDTGSTKLAVMNGSSVSGIELFEDVITGGGSDRITFSQSTDNTINTDSGNDTINSGLGSDYVDGGDGSDVLIVNYATASNPILSSVSFNGSGNSGFYNNSSDDDSVSFSNIDRFNVTGTKFDDDIKGGTGFDTLQGKGGTDTLDGGAGIDSLIGGDGNDAYIVDSTGDAIVEAVTGGIDTVFSTVSYTLAANVDNLTLTTTNAVNGVGNTLIGNSANNMLTGSDGMDTLSGGTGNDTLAGGLGNDLLTGGTGADHFSFNSPTDSLDTIKDFATVDDTISVSAAGFGGGLTAGGVITAEQLFSGAGVIIANNASVRFIYNTSNGALFFDADGNGTGTAMQIATLTGTPNLTNADIFVTT